MGDIQHFNSVRSLADGRSTALQQCTVPSWWTDTAAGAAGWPGVGAERVLVDSGDGQGRPPACSRPVHLSIGPQPGWGRPDRPPPPPPLCKHRRGYHNKSPNKNRHWAIMFLLFPHPYLLFLFLLVSLLSFLPHPTAISVSNLPQLEVPPPRSWQVWVGRLQCLHTWTDCTTGTCNLMKTTFNLQGIQYWAAPRSRLESACPTVNGGTNLAWRR